RLYYQPWSPSDGLRVCGRCRTVHLHEGLGWCITCLERLGPPRSESGPLDEEPDYYAFLALPSAEPFRLNGAELTGQTDPHDAIRRQRLFQGRCLGQENERAEVLDVLSVTTTMEAGVD